MYDNKTVSVIIPVYNCEEYIEQTIKSVINQTYQNLEIVLIDDCSTDNSFDIINKIQKQYSNKIVLKKQEINMGVAVARNTALNLAKGRYVAFLDSDDLWYSTKIEKQVSLLENNDQVPMCFTAIHMIDEKGNKIKGKRKVALKIGYKRLLHNTMIATSSVMINRNVVFRVEMPNRKSAEDYSLWLEITKKYGYAFGINEDLVAYRKSSMQITNNRFGELKFFYRVQVEDHNINKLFAFFNTMIYSVIAAKKHYL
ncbi:MAG: glycosyltransferase family 2 protein [Pleomorphochaeta sp.]